MQREAGHWEDRVQEVQVREYQVQEGCVRENIFKVPHMHHQYL